ncbi:TadE/TadG family type IV pilus assembly protein [Roseibium aggregatum]|uniref:Pilus assembly protein n=1 Tax=Roseibium aggregatum TaxID=187304 RepID=A0A939J2H7_9HYPH|nr:TadE/TadG family type IV pilus assembly protein [Roseibium aggregatum]MBN9673196.1 pilus assembly protein [Roseibium aggregatum]
MCNRKRVEAISRLQQLAQDKNGSIVPLFAIMVLIMIVIFGAAVDVSRSVSAREKLSYAIDAAALSVAAQLSTTVMTDSEITEALSETFAANLEGEEFLEKALDNLEFTVDADNGTISVTSSATLDNYFIDLGGFLEESFGPDFMEFGNSGQVSYSKFDVELALVVDVTGSMTSNDMQTLREASTEVVNILLPDTGDTGDAKVRISLIPYSQGVNLGDYASKVKGGAYYSERVSGNCVTERQDYEDFEVMLTDDSYDYYDEAEIPPFETFFGGGTNGCSSSAKMVPLTNDRETLLPAISALTDQGGTAGQTGIAWGWYSLSPNYVDVWPSDSAPAYYSDEETLKFAIIMTDGDNNRYYDFVETEWQKVCTGKKKKKTCSWQEVPVNEWQEVGEGESYSNTSSTRSRDLCDAMKNAGIEVFGVYFGTNDYSAGAKNMQSCASDGNYYQASSSSALIKAFANIARKIQQIYVSK